MYSQIFKTSLILSGLSILVGCGVQANTGAPSTPILLADKEESETQSTFSGNASWYGLPFHGRKTASGELFDMNKLSAAHKTLPFPTKVLVENPRNGQSVTIRVTDRGPFVKGRILDLSREAARRIGTFPGVGFVEATVIATKQTSTFSSATKSKEK